MKTLVDLWFHLGTHRSLQRRAVGGQCRRPPVRRARLLTSAYSFTAPVLVFMIRFWNTKNTTATGIVITAAAASLSGYCVPWLEAARGQLRHALGQRVEVRARCSRR